MEENKILIQIGQHIRDIGVVAKSGGRGSLFGNLAIFEIIMREKHDLMTDEEIKNNFPFNKFTGFECYGNIVEEKYSIMAIQYCRNELKFTDDEFMQLLNWFNNRKSPDTYVTMYFICKEIFDESLFKKILEKK